MTFVKKIAAHVGQQVQAATAVETFSGILLSADDTFVVIQRDGEPGNPVTILTEAIAYVRTSV
jgi:hypothetical protein